MKKLISMAFFAFSICVASAANSASEAGTEKIEIAVDNNYLLVPMKGGAEYRKFGIVDDSGVRLAWFDGLLSGGTPDWFAEIDISAFKGKKISFVYEKPSDGEAVKLMQVAAPDARPAFADRGRPRYHLTAKRGWLGNPCGLVSFNGVWHAFYLGNQFALNSKEPFSIAHAYTRDFVNWTHLKTAFAPKFDKNGVSFPVAASAAVAVDNSSGLFDSSKGGVLFAYADSRRGVCLAQSSDMVSFKDCFAEPIIARRGGAEFRSVQIFFNPDSKLWTVVLGVVEKKRKSGHTEIHTSADLKKWVGGTVEGVDFCDANLRKMPVSGVDSPDKWVLFNGDGRYVVGSFDGAKFINESQKSFRIFYGNFWGGQFWSGTDRNLVSGWIPQPADLIRDLGMSFSQSMSMPWELRLVRADEGFQLRAVLPPEISDHFGPPSNALGVPVMRFRQNEFSLPDSVGNRHVLMGQLDTTDTLLYTIGLGVSRFSYSKEANAFALARIDDISHILKAQTPIRSGLVEFMLFVDTYSLELFFCGGEAVLFAGDSYLNDEQQLRIGAREEICVESMSKVPLLSTTLKERGESALKAMKEANQKEPKNAKDEKVEN